MSSNTSRLESLLEAVPDALVGMDQGGTIRFVTHQTEALFGYDRDELIGRPIETLVPESLWQIYAEHREDYFTDPRTRSSGIELELTGRHRNGSAIPVNITLSHIDTGDVLLVVTAVSDVAKRKRAVETASLTAAIVEYSDDAIMGSTLGGFITSWNPAAERMYGYSAHDMIGKPDSLLTPEDRFDELDDVLARVREGQAVENLETARLRKDGTQFPVSITVAPIRDESGGVIGASAVHRDVTEQRRAFEATQRIATIVEDSNDAIIANTLDGIITSWNLAAERLYGYCAQEIVGRSVGLLVPAGQTEEITSIRKEINAGEHVEELETTRVRKDGTVFPVSITVSPIRDQSGTVVGASSIVRDITEAKHAALYARSLIEAELDPMVTITPEGKINDVNEATVRVTGVPREALIGTDFSQYATDPEGARRVYQQVFASGSIADCPLTWRHSDGTLTDVECNGSVYRDTGGNVLGVLVVARDITRQKEAFEAAQQLAAIVQNSQDAIFSCTLDGTITSWNPAAERVYGYSFAEIIGVAAKILTPSDRVSEMKAVLEQIRAGRPVEHLETKRIRKNGQLFPVSLTISPIRDPGGTVVGTSVIHRDLTEQMGALASARRMAAIVENSDDAIIGRTLDGIITSWNQAAERLYGYSSQEVIGKPVDLLTPQDRAGETISILAKISAGHSIDHYETTSIRKDGTLIQVALTISPIRDEEGAVVGASVICRRMTHTIT
jgi:PAS domain S-box-containing protein